MEPRIVELELKYTEQQAMLESLSDVLHQQQRLIDALRAELTRLRDKLDAEPGLVDARTNERPPHY